MFRFTSQSVSIVTIIMATVVSATVSHAQDNLSSLPLSDSAVEWRIDPSTPVSGQSFKAWDQESGLPPFAACTATTDENKEIAAWDDVVLGKPDDFHHYKHIIMPCGNKDFGLNHIKRNHPEWDANAGIEGKTGEALIRLAIDAALEKTEYSVRKDVSDPEHRRDGTFCATSQIYLVNKVRGTIEKTLNPTIIVGENNEKIISAYPTDHDRCREA